jgi:hypothetical protein
LPMRAHHLVAVLVAGSAVACSSPKDMRAVAGTYVVHRKWAADIRGTALLRPTTLALTIEYSWLGKLRLVWYPTFGWWYDRIAAGA